MRWFGCLALYLFLAAISWLPSAFAQTANAPRIALVIGNEDYPPKVGRLSNPHEDADKVAAALQGLGFRLSSGRVVRDATRDGMSAAIEAFARELNAAGDSAIAFFYYSGHGGSHEDGGGRTNYLLPAKAEITEASQLPWRGVSLNALISTLNATSAASIFVVSDACRDTLPLTSNKGGAQRDRGFVPVSARRTLVAYATADGLTAPDDGVFAEVLARYLPQRVSVDRLFTLVGREVASRRQGNGLPVVRDSLGEDVFLAGLPSPATERVTVEVPVLPDEAGTAFAAALTADRLDLWQDFERRFPAHPQIGYARTRIAALNTSTVTVPGPSESAGQLTFTGPITGARLERTISLADAGCRDDPGTPINECAVSSVAFSPDGTRLASGSEDTTIRLWDAASGAEIARLEGHEGTVFSVAFSPDGTRLASGSDDNTARLWDSRTGAELARLTGHGDTVWSVAFSADGARLASGSDDNTIRLWDAASGAELQRLEGHWTWVCSVAFSPDGTRLASGSADHTIRLWDIATGAEMARLEGHGDWVCSVAFSPDRTRLASGSWDDTIRLWDLASGAELARLEGHGGSVYSIAVSPDGTRLASGSSDNTIRLWDVATGSEIARLDGHRGEVSSVAFSPDGTRLASGSYDGTVKIWALERGEP